MAHSSVGGVTTGQLNRVRMVTVPRPAPRMSWESRYRAFVACADLTSLVLAAVVICPVVTAVASAGMPMPRALLLAVTILAGCIALPMHRSWDSVVLGQGAEEYRRLGRALLTVMVVVALIGILAGEHEIRWWVFGVVPAAGLIAFLLRYVLRKVLHAQRRTGKCMLPVLAAGGAESVSDLIARVRREPHNGWQVQAACVPGGAENQHAGEFNGISVVGSTDDVATIARRGGYRVVAITADAAWSPSRLRKLARDLEGSTADLVVAPVLLEVAWPRLHVSPVFGLPLMRVSAPAFTGPRRVVKECTDRGLAMVLTLLLLPLMLTIGVLVRTTSPGPALYGQRRVGKGGHEFVMLKFRTMVQNAEVIQPELAQNNDAAGPLFKLRRDPRVTRLGRLLRRFSLDELPQLFNVLAGSMSLVGPRPPLPAEVRRFGPDSLRRLLVKPGLTGLWQVSGRSDLSWEDTVRLDLRYVENWSLALDLVILWKTGRAVLSGKGAY